MGQGASAAERHHPRRCGASVAPPHHGTALVGSKHTQLDRWRAAQGAAGPRFRASMFQEIENWAGRAAARRCPTKSAQWRTQAAPPKRRPGMPGDNRAAGEGRPRSRNAASNVAALHLPRKKTEVNKDQRAPGQARGRLARPKCPAGAWQAALRASSRPVAPASHAGSCCAGSCCVGRASVGGGAAAGSAAGVATGAGCATEGSTP